MGDPLILGDKMKTIPLDDEPVKGAGLLGGELIDCIDSGLALVRARAWTDYFRSTISAARIVGQYPADFPTLGAVTDSLTKAVDTIALDVGAAMSKIKEMRPVMNSRFESIAKQVNELRNAIPDKAFATALELEHADMISSKLQGNISETLPFIVADCACDVCRE